MRCIRRTIGHHFAVAHPPAQGVAVVADDTTADLAEEIAAVEAEAMVVVVDEIAEVVADGNGGNGGGKNEYQRERSLLLLFRSCFRVLFPLRTFCWKFVTAWKRKKRIKYANAHLDGLSEIRKLYVCVLVFLLVKIKFNGHTKARVRLLCKFVTGPLSLCFFV